MSKVSFLLVLGVLWIASILKGQAQDKKLRTWTTVNIEHKLKPVFTLSAGLEWRAKNNLSQTDRLELKMGASYDPFSFLKMKAGYEVHYRNREYGIWRFRHRYHLEGTLLTRLQQIKFALRERFQHTIDGGNNELRMRSRFKLAYDIPKCKPEPYVSVEMYNSLEGKDHFDIKRMRYRSGVCLPVSNWTADIFYCLQKESDESRHIIGLEFVYEF